MTATRSKTKTCASVIMALVLAFAFMPFAAWVTPVMQADAQPQSETAPLVEAVSTYVDGNDDGPLVAQASGDTVKVSGVNYYDKAVEVLNIVNKERKAHGLAELTLDAELSERAMLRAAELSAFYNHTRPSGKEWTSAFSYASGWLGENIAVGQTDADAVMNSWFYEEKKLYDAGERDKAKVGHYLNIISADYKSIGIGCFTQGAYMCWEQVFSSNSASGTPRTRAENRTHSVEISYDTCGSKQAFNLDRKSDAMRTLNVGQTFKMSYDIRNDGWEYMACRIDGSSAKWTTTDTGILTVASDGTVTAQAAGRANVVAQLPSGKSLVHAWDVTQQMGSAVVDIPDQTYTGSPIEPKPAVTANGRPLTEGVDYDVRYEYNVNVGTASMVLTGKGNFTGSKDVKFTIAPAAIDTIELSQTEFGYDGTEKKPRVTVRSGSLVLTENRDFYVEWPSDVINLGPRTLTVQAMGNFKGTMTADYAITVDGPASVIQTMYRLYNPNSGEHFYTAKPSERDSVAAAGWTYEGEAWIAPTSSNTPVYRLYSGTDHHYTMSAAERDALVAAGWSDEGIGWYSDDDEGVPLYRQFNPNVDPTAPTNNSGSHNYTTDINEHWSLVGIGWADEGIGWYGVK